MLKKVIADEFRRHAYLLDSKVMTDDAKKEEFIQIKNRIASEIDYITSLQDLSAYLFDFHGKKPIVLIDEYDTPINAAFDNDYYAIANEFMKSLMSCTFKDNKNIEKGVNTGC